MLVSIVAFFSSIKSSTGKKHRTEFCFEEEYKYSITDTRLKDIFTHKKLGTKKWGIRLCATNMNYDEKFNTMDDNELFSFFKSLKEKEELEVVLFINGLYCFQESKVIFTLSQKDSKPIKILMKEKKTLILYVKKKYIVVYSILHQGDMVIIENLGILKKPRFYGLCQ